MNHPMKKVPFETKSTDYYQDCSIFIVKKWKLTNFWNPKESTSNYQ